MMAGLRAEKSKSVGNKISEPRAKSTTSTNVAANVERLTCHRGYALPSVPGDDIDALGFGRLLKLIV